MKKTLSIVGAAALLGFSANVLAESSFTQSIMNQPLAKADARVLQQHPQVALLFGLLPDVGVGHSAPNKIKGTGRTQFHFWPSRGVYAAYDKSGKLVKTGRASGGADYCPDVKRACRTPVGSFTVGRKGGASCKSSKYPLGRGGAPMPHCMFFAGGAAIHGSPWVPRHNASHGCIRVHPRDARWLHNSFLSSGSRVKVYSY